MEGLSNIEKSNIGNATPADIDEIDTIPVINRTPRKTTMQPIVSKGCNAKSIPKKVATPFPPLKPARRGNICPMIATTPVRICRLVSNALHGSARFKKTGNMLASQPLAASMIITGMPVFQPSTLITFVAPAFPLPCCLTSML